MTAPHARRLTVDGEVFDVLTSDDGRGLHFDWVSGPNPGYGFRSFASMVFIPVGEQAPDAVAQRDDADLIAHIRTFLGQIDPETGYIAE